MFIDENYIPYYNAEYDNELETDDLPLDCPYRQMKPFPSFPGGPQGPQSPPRPQGPQGPPRPQGAPNQAPPNFTPSQSNAHHFGATPLAVDQGAIRPCIHRFVYIWPRRGRGFWAWLVFVGPRSVAGFRWNGRNWTYFGMDLRQISSFQCF